MNTTLEIDRYLRRDVQRPVRRIPTDRMSRAPLQVGVVSWRHAWETSADGTLQRWAIGVHDVVKNRTTIVEGHGHLARPAEEIARHVSHLLDDDAEQAWVGVSANRLALYRQLEGMALHVTCGGEHNTGLMDAIEHMQVQTAESMRAHANRATVAPESERVDLQRIRPLSDTVSTGAIRRWEPSVFRFEPGRGGALVACDGSYHQGSMTGAYAAVSSGGDMRADVRQLGSVGDAELIALVTGLEVGLDSGARSFALLSDSISAIDRLERMLVDRSAEHPELRARFHRIRRLLPSDVLVHHVRSRTEHALHDVADALSFAARRVSTMARGTSETQFELLVDELEDVVRELPPVHPPDRSIKRLVIERLAGGNVGA